MLICRVCSGAKLFGITVIFVQVSTGQAIGLENIFGAFGAAAVAAVQKMQGFGSAWSKEFEKTMGLLESLRLRHVAFRVRFGAANFPRRLRLAS